MAVPGRLRLLDNSFTCMKVRFLRYEISATESFDILSPKITSGLLLIFSINHFHESTPPGISPSQAEKEKGLFCLSNTLQIEARRLIHGCFDSFVTDNSCLQQSLISLLVLSSGDCATKNLRGKLTHEFRICLGRFLYSYEVLC